MSVHTHLRPDCHLLSKPPFLSTPHPSTTLLLFSSFSFHTLRAKAASVLFFFFRPYMIGHTCLSDDRPRVVHGDVTLRKRRGPVFFFFYISQRIIVFGTSWEEDGLWGCDRRKHHTNADIDRALDQYWKNHAGHSQ